jgi:hypothetical protein
MTMPFNLKNAGSTYQRCMQRCLDDLVGEVIEVYIDDIVVNSRKADHLVENLEQTFARLRFYRVKLNPEKCNFGVSKGNCSASSSPSEASRPTRRRSWSSKT